MKHDTLLTMTAALLISAALPTGCGKKPAGQAGDAAPADGQQFCPVSGEKLGSMGKPYAFEYKGRRIQLCCDGCKDDFDKDPEKYLSKLGK